VGREREREGKGREEKGGSVTPSPIGESGSTSDYQRYPVMRYL